MWHIYQRAYYHLSAEKWFCLLECIRVYMYITMLTVLPSTTDKLRFCVRIHRYNLVRPAIDIVSVLGLFQALGQQQIAKSHSCHAAKTHLQIERNKGNSHSIAFHMWLEYTVYVDCERTLSRLIMTTTKKRIKSKVEIGRKSSHKFNQQKKNMAKFLQFALGTLTVSQA